MWQLLVIVAALAQNHAADFKAGWERAKARADLWDKYHHGLIDRHTLMRERLKLLTPRRRPRSGMPSNKAGWSLRRGTGSFSSWKKTE